jgi:hypothetical protein
MSYFILVSGGLCSGPVDTNTYMETSEKIINTGKSTGYGLSSGPRSIVSSKR